MESHLSTLDATLASIAQLQRPLFTHPAPRPFTLAFLDRREGGQRGRDFIRESDSIERRLFHFPPPNGGGESSDGQGYDVAPAAPGTPPPAQDVLLRNPQVRSVAVPTPLRSGKGGGGRVGVDDSDVTTSTRRRSTAAAPPQYDAYALLVAAQRLNDNYQHGPRARKHIKGLIKQAKESSAQNAAHADQAAKLELVLSLLASGKSVEDIVRDRDDLAGVLGGEVAAQAASAPSASSSASSSSLNSAQRLRQLHQRTQDLKAQLNREEMEVLALEEMREDVVERTRQLQQKRWQQEQEQQQQQPLRPPQPASSPSTLTSSPQTARKPPLPSSTTASSSPRARARATPSKSPVATTRPVVVEKKPTRPPPTSSSSSTRPPTSTSTAATRARLSRLAPRASSAVKKPSAVGASAGASASGASATKASSAAAAGKPPRAIDEDDGDGTAKSPVPPTPSSPTSSQPPPSSSPTPLQRSSSSTDSADVTIRAAPLTTATTSPGAPPVDIEPTDELERLTEKIWDVFGDQLRLLSGGDAATLETADFTTTLGMLRSITDMDRASIPGTAQSSISSLVLLLLLTSPPPDHSMEFGQLKAEGREWWQGKKATTAENAVSEEADVDVDGEQLTTKAVYALVAKRLLRVRRTGGEARVGFGS